MLLPVQQVTTVATTVMFPVLSRVQGNCGEFREIFLKANRIIAFLTFPLMAAALVLAEPLIRLVYGIQWLGAIPIFQVLCIEGMGQSVGSTMGWIYNALGQTRLQLRWGLFAFAVRAVAIVVGLPWGAFGVAVSYTVFGYLVLWYPAWTIPGRLIGLSFSTMVNNIAGVFMASLGMGAAIWTVKSLLPQEAVVLQVATGVLVGGVFFLGLVHMLRVRTYVELVWWLRDVRIRRGL